MTKPVNIINLLHRKTSREYLPRMADNKIHCMDVASRYDRDYWDGERCYGYGGYSYDGRWKIVAEALIKRYSLKNDARIFDVGCGKAFLLYELSILLPQARVNGIDISEYAICHAPEQIRANLQLHAAQEEYNFEDEYFDLVLSVNTLHNLQINELKVALQEIERVGKDKFICVESYRNNSELFNLQCWALTCESFYRPAGWQWLFKEFNYTGDYEFIFFE